jgi:hypothetical protein
MNNSLDVYEIEEQKSERDIKFFFVSKGREDIIKAIQYSFVQELSGRNVYNLGFGDYDLEADTIIDNADTNNGDVYKVFNTVLSTIPIFFESRADEILMVLGSDGRPQFIEDCRQTCTKKCGNECKNFNRRINIYRNYVDKNYAQLAIDYQFFGGFVNELSQTILEDYICGKKYDVVLLSKRKV